MCKRREKPAGCWQKWLSPQSVRTRRNPRKHAVVGKKKANRLGLAFKVFVVGCYQGANEQGIAISGPDQAQLASAKSLVASQ